MKLLQWLMSSVWDISLVIIRGFCSTNACNCSLLRLHARPLHSSSSRLPSPLRNSWNYLRTVRSHLDAFPHALLILVEVFEALCQSLNSCNIRRQKSRFDIFHIEGFVCFKTVLFLKINYKLLLRCHYLVYKLKFT